MDTHSVSTHSVPMNLTLSVDPRVVEEARRTARSLGKSLDQLVREYLEQLARSSSVEEEIEELRHLSAASGGRSRGGPPDRDELHERR